MSKIIKTITIFLFLFTAIELTHDEFSTNLHPISYNVINHSSPSQVYGSHGTHVAGIIGANQNGNQVSGVAPTSQLMSVSHSLSLTPNISAELAEGISWAWQNGASIINNSWGDQGGAYLNQLQSALLENAITDALTQGRNGLGTIVVFASGNFAPTIDYPAYFTPEILCVGATTISGTRSGFSGFGNVLDVVAPGSNILSTVTGNSTGNNSGTSMAAPHACGVAALILSVNHNLTRQQVVDIIESTSQKLSAYTYTTTGGRPNGTWNNETGYGLLDANAAVILAQSSCTSTQLDLFSKDTWHDFGLEPNPANSYTYNPYNNLMWLSDDIWVRNQADGEANQQHQNPEHSSTNDPNQLNYVYVRVRNKGCVASTGTETLDLRWAKASTSLGWPNNWDGTLDLDPPNNAWAGDLISTQAIPVIPAGGETILEFTWNPPSPADYSFNYEPQHFCLLSRIISTNDPMTFAEGSSIGANVVNNNNIAWKNLTVVDNIAGLIGGGCPAELMNAIGVGVRVANPKDEQKKYDVVFSVPQEELLSPITKEGTVTISLDNKLYEKWADGGKQGTGFSEIISPPMNANGVAHNNINSHSPIVITNRKMFEVTETETKFTNITLDPKENRTVSIMITYPSEPVSDKQNFVYDIQQKETVTGNLIGGVRYDIRKPVNDDPPTDAGNNVSIKRGCNTTLTASPQKDCYAYFWLNQQGNIISQQPTITVSPNNTTTYTLKIVSAQGFVSKDNITVSVLNQQCAKEREIIRINPNPAKEKITVKYKAENTSVAHLRLVKTDNSIDKIYPLNLQMTEATISLSDCTHGSYVVSLVCDGVNEDSKALIIH